LHNYILNIAVDICLKTFVIVKDEIDHLDGRISVNNIEARSCDVFLYLTKPDNVLPIILINVEIADTELEKMKLRLI
jgi:hypothetical protein